MGRVGVLLLVAVLVMVAVMVGPPKGAALDGGAAPDGEEELAEAGGGVGLVGEIAVVDAGDGEHAQEVEGDGRPGGEGAPTGPDHSEAAEVQHDEGHDAHPVDLVGLLAHFFRAIGAVVGVDPLDDSGEQAAREGTGGGRHESGIRWEVAQKGAEETGRGSGVQDPSIGLVIRWQTQIDQVEKHAG